MYQLLIRSDYCHIGEGTDTAVVLGWFPLRKFQNRIDKKLYAVAGSLFSGGLGINLFLRNILFNPQITNIVICGFTNEDSITKSCDTLENLFLGNVSLSSINTIEPKIPESAFIELKNSVKVTRVLNLNQLEATLKKIEPGHTTRTRYTLPLEIKSSENTQPGRINSQNVQAKTLKQGHVEALRRIRLNGRYEADKGIQELLNLSITTNDATTLEELLRNCTPDLKQYVENFLNGTKSSDNYGYGDRLLQYFGFNQVSTIIDKLKRKSGSLAGLMCLWDTQDLIKGDSPCLTQVWARIVDGCVLLFATFRSNDIYRAWLSNATALRALQIVIANSLELKMGELTTISLSAHVYNVSFADIDDYVITNQLIGEPKYHSCVGNFVINVDEQIQVTQVDNEQNYVSMYQGRYASELIVEITQYNPTIEPDHIGYLGIELCKAEMALRHNKKYSQDQPLK